MDDSWQNPLRLKNRDQLDLAKGLLISSKCTEGTLEE
jgi:hypothetical protein